MATKEEIREYRGCENIYVARVTTDDADGFETDTPQYLAGASTISRTINNETSTKYYDNGPAIQTSSLSAPELTLSISALSNAKLAYITGLKYDSDLDALDLGDYDPVDCALMYNYSLSNGDTYYVVFYKGRFSIPEGSYATQDESADNGTGVEVTFKASRTVYKFTKTNKQGVGQEYLCPGNDTTKAKAKLATFFDAVKTPDTIEANTTTATGGTGEEGGSGGTGEEGGSGGTGEEGGSGGTGEEGESGGS